MLFCYQNLNYATIIKTPFITSINMRLITFTKKTIEKIQFVDIKKGGDFSPP
jgi:hypothetical protein